MKSSFSRGLASLLVLLPAASFAKPMAVICCPQGFTSSPQAKEPAYEIRVGFYGGPEATPSDVEEVFRYFKDLPPTSRYYQTLRYARQGAWPAGTYQAQSIFGDKAVLTILDPAHPGTEYRGSFAYFVDKFQGVNAVDCHVEEVDGGI